MFGSSLDRLICWRTHVVIVFVCVWWSPTHIMLWFFFRLESCVPNVASFSGLSILYCPFGVLCRLFRMKWHVYTQNIVSKS